MLRSISHVVKDDLLQLLENNNDASLVSHAPNRNDYASVQKFKSFFFTKPEQSTNALSLPTHLFLKYAPSTCFRGTQLFPFNLKRARLPAYLQLYLLAKPRQSRFQPQGTFDIHERLPAQSGTTRVERTLHRNRDSFATLGRLGSALTRAQNEARKRKTEE